MKRSRPRSSKKRRRGGHLLEIRPKVPSLPYADPPTEIEELFRISDTLRETMERIGSNDGAVPLKNHDPADKLEIKITDKFSMFVQNSVYTSGVQDITDAGEEDPENSRLDMAHIGRAMRYRGGQFNQARFESHITRSHAFDSATLTFTTGKMVITGCSRPERALWQLQRDTEILARVLPFQCKVITPKLENLVSSGLFPNSICTCYMTIKYSTICADVGKFPGTLIKDTRYFAGRAIVVFDSGRICHLGSRSATQVYQDIIHIMPILLDCQATPELVQREAELREEKERREAEKLQKEEARNNANALSAVGGGFGLEELDPDAEYSPDWPTNET